MKREYTKFGEELKVLRTRRHQSIQDMADVLGVSKGFLSRVESGKKAVPGDWIDILCDHYHLKPYPRQILEDAAALSKTRIQILLREVPGDLRDKPLADTGLKNDLNILVMLVERGGRKAEAPDGYTVFQKGDKLTVFGDIKTICRAFQAREQFIDEE